MFCLIKCSKKVLAAVAALLCCGGMLAAIWQTKEVLGSAYEDLYPDMYVSTDSEFAKEEGKVVYYTFDDGPSKNTIAILDTLKEKESRPLFS